MIKVGNAQILTPLIDIITELKTQLSAAGVERFYKIKELHSDVMVSCPNHASKRTGEIGQESKPSCGISKVEKNGLPAGYVNCFSCGYKVPLSEMISHCFGHDDVGRFGVNWLLDNFVSIESDNRVPLQLVPERQFMPKEKKQINYVTEEELDSYRFTHPYMYKRKLTDEIIEKFDIGYDKNTNCVTFPVWDEKGNCLFIARRSVVSKFFNYPENVDKPLYGLHFIPKNVECVIVTESIINALTCWVYGHPAIALIGTGSFAQMEMLNKSHIRKFILALDPDEAGYKGTLRIRNKIDKRKVLTEFEIPIGKDVNDLSKEEFESLPEYYLTQLTNDEYKKLADKTKNGAR